MVLERMNEVDKLLLQPLPPPAELEILQLQVLSMETAGESLHVKQIETFSRIVDLDSIFDDAYAMGQEYKLKAHSLHDFLSTSLLDDGSRLQAFDTRLSDLEIAAVHSTANFDEGSTAIIWILLR